MENKIKQVVLCHHCNNVAPQKLVFKHDCFDFGFYENGEKTDFPYDVRYYVTVCETCGDLSIYGASVEIFDEKDFKQATLIYPYQKIDLNKLPVIVRKCYIEAVRVKNNAPNAFAMLIRKALEAICDDKGILEGSLYDKINELSKKNLIPKNLSDMGDIIRLIGNIGAHNTTLDVKPGFVNTIDDFFISIIEYIYIQPDKITAIQEKLKKHKVIEDSSSNPAATG